jgi:hypothetical protein
MCFYPYFKAHSNLNILPPCILFDGVYFSRNCSDGIFIRDRFGLGSNLLPVSTSGMIVLPSIWIANSIAIATQIPTPMPKNSR